MEAPCLSPPLMRSSGPRIFLGPQAACPGLIRVPRILLLARRLQSSEPSGLLPVLSADPPPPVPGAGVIHGKPLRCKGSCSFSELPPAVQTSSSGQRSSTLLFGESRLKCKGRSLLVSDVFGSPQARFDLFVRHRVFVVNSTARCFLRRCPANRGLEIVSVTFRLCGAIR